MFFSRLCFRELRNEDLLRISQVTARGRPWCKLFFLKCCQQCMRHSVAVISWADGELPALLVLNFRLLQALFEPTFRTQSRTSLRPLHSDHSTPICSVSLQEKKATHTVIQCFLLWSYNVPSQAFSKLFSRLCLQSWTWSPIHVITPSARFVSSLCRRQKGTSSSSRVSDTVAMTEGECRFCWWRHEPPRRRDSFSGTSAIIPSMSLSG